MSESPRDCTHGRLARKCEICELMECERLLDAKEKECEELLFVLRYISEQTNITHIKSMDELLFVLRYISEQTNVTHIKSMAVTTLLRLGEKP